jgi:hypothetical protein
VHRMPCLTASISSASWGLRPRRLLRRFAPPPAPSALPPGIPQGFALGLRPHPSMGPQRGLSRSPNRAGGYRPLCPALRAALFDSPGRGFAPPHRYAAVPLPNSRLSRAKAQLPCRVETVLAFVGEQASPQSRRLMETEPAAAPQGPGASDAVPLTRSGEGGLLSMSFQCPPLPRRKRVALYGCASDAVPVFAMRMIGLHRCIGL